VKTSSIVQHLEPPRVQQLAATRFAGLLYDEEPDSAVLLVPVRGAERPVPLNGYHTQWALVLPTELYGEPAEPGQPPLHERVLRAAISHLERDVIKPLHARPELANVVRYRHVPFCSIPICPFLARREVLTFLVGQAGCVHHARDAAVVQGHAA
jgi:hypothetical protein